VSGIVRIEVLSRFSIRVAPKPRALRRLVCSFRSSPLTPYPHRRPQGSIAGGKNTIPAPIISPREISISLFLLPLWITANREERRLQAEREHNKRNKKQQGAG